MYADDLKIFKRIDFAYDCVDLQNDLLNLLSWCSKWKILLNLKKCRFVNFSLKRKLDIHFQYYLESSALSKVDEIKDLGVYFTNRLSFNHHISFIVCKAFCMLGFVCQTCYKVL